MYDRYARTRVYACVGFPNVPDRHSARFIVTVKLGRVSLLSPVECTAVPLSDSVE